MGAHEWARGAIDKALSEARQAGLDEALIVATLDRQVIHAAQAG